MTIFDHLNDILFTKRGKCLDNVDDETQFNPYMINRWCSMYSDNLARIINHTTNRLHSIFTDKQQYYKFVSKVLPRVNRRRINYIKKKKPEENEQEVDNIKLMAKRLELSESEIKSYYEHIKHRHSTSSPGQT